MNLRYFTLLSSLSALAVGGAMLAPTRAFAEEQGYEELTRGPVHEAFAGSVSFDPEPGMLVRTAPPELIEEVPPEQALEGENVAWIPGYWGWEEDQNDFIWISGIWRNLPPGRQWVPGYWSEAGDQWQWTSGYWADEEADEVAYLPEPPKSIETGPNVESPSENHIWISGTWVNREERYAWRPGYWEPGQQDWTWIPAHYQWTRRGYVFIDGYWDYNVVRRGVVFAPVRFQRSYYNRPNYSYTPLMVISLNVFANHLFVRPSYGHYYFGDYYAPRYRNEGFYASYSYHSGRRGYDPIYAHDRWQHRSERDWERRRSDDYNFYRDNEDARPPRTWAALSSRPEGSRRGQRDNYEFAQPLNRYAERSESGQRFQAMTSDRRTQLVSQRQEVRKFAQERKQVEGRAVPKEAAESETRSRVKREKLSKSPLVAKRAEQLSGKDAPPKRRVTRDADLPEPKNAGRNAEDGKKGDATKKGDKPTPTKRGETDQPEKGKGKSTEQERGKSTEQTRGKSTEQTRGKSTEQERGKKGEPAPKADSGPGKKGDQEPKDSGRKDTRPAPKPEMEKGRKEAPPSRKPGEANPEKKQAERPETPRKPEPRVTPKPTPRPEAQPQRKAEPQKEKERAKAPTEQIREQAPKRQIKEENKPSAQPAKRQAAEAPRRAPEVSKRQVAEAPRREVREAPKKVQEAPRRQVSEAPRKAQEAPKRQVAEAPKRAPETERGSAPRKAARDEEAEDKKKKN